MVDSISGDEGVDAAMIRLQNEIDNTKTKAFEIHFPKAFTYFLKLLSMLPSSIYFKIVEKGMKKIDY